MSGVCRAFILGLALAVCVVATAEAAKNRGLTVKLRASEAENAPVADEVELYSASHALVIGIDDYRSGWPRLSMAVEDARAIATVLESKGFSVSLLTNLDSRGLDDALKEFFAIKGANPAARLFLWYAGHGHTEDGEGFLVPADAPRPDASGRFRLKALSLRRIGEYVRLAQSKHAFAIFDSCFSGTVFDSARALPPAAVTRATTLPVRQFLTSGDAGQTVSDDGTFRELFLRALKGEERADSNGDGYVTASEIGLFLADRMTNLTMTRQTPRYGKLRDKDWDRGDFVFSLPAGVVARPQIAAPTPGAPSASGSADIVFWQSIQKSDNPDSFKAYLSQFPNGTFAPLARVKLKELERRKLAAARPPARRTPPAARPAVGVYPKPKPKPRFEEFRDCPDCPEMVKIPAGKFRMGHSRISGHYAIVAKPVHTVTIAKPFAMSKYEVTFEEYDRFTAETGRRSLPDKGWGRGRHPALRVPRADVIAYTEWLSTETGKRYRLPSEAEWEYAARGGTKANFWWGDSPSHEYANYGSGQPGWFPAGVIEGRDRWQFTAPVGSFRPNPFGLYDMNGNLWEHVLDCFHDSYKEAPVDGSARMKAPDEEGFEEDEKIEGGECTNFVMRGGSWGYNPNFMMSATRIKVFWGVEAFLHYGIRLVRELD